MERTTFNGLAGELLIKHANLSQGQVDKVIAIQADIKAKEPDPKKVPLTGDIAVKEGMIKPEAKDAILLAQAAERMAQSGEGKGQGVPLSKDGKSFDFENKMFTRDFIGKNLKDSPELVQAQATEHLGALIDGAVKINPEIASRPEITKAREALKTLASGSYTDAAKQMESSGLKPESVKTAKDYAKDLTGGSMSRNEALVALHDGLQAASAGLPPEQQAKFTEVGSKRESQIKLDMSAHKLSDNLEKTQDGRGSNDRQALDAIKKQFGLNPDTGKGHLSSQSSSQLVKDVADVAQGGVSLSEITKVRETFAQAEKGLRNKGDVGTTLAANELREFRAQVKDGLSK